MLPAWLTRIWTSVYRPFDKSDASESAIEPPAAEWHALAHRTARTQRTPIPQYALHVLFFCFLVLFFCCFFCFVFFDFFVVDLSRNYLEMVSVDFLSAMPRLRRLLLTKNLIRELPGMCSTPHYTHTRVNQCSNEYGDIITDHHTHVHSHMLTRSSWVKQSQWRKSH